MTREILHELKREFPDAEIRVTGSNHYRIVLANGRTVTVSGTPSDRNYLRIAISDARRQSKHTGRMPATKEK